VTPVREQELKLARIIYYLCGLPYGKDTSGLLQQNPVLKLPLQNFIFAIVFMAGQLQGLSIITTRHLLPLGRNKDIHNLFTQAYYIFEDWPNYFYQFLRWWSTQERDSSLTSERLKSPLYKDFGKLYIGLYKILSDRQFDFIREAFIDYLTREWEGCNIPSTNRTKGRRRYRKSKYVSKADAIRLLEADNQGIDQLIEDGSLKTIVRSKGMKRLIFVDVADIAELLSGRLD
jgi:hypothetical protein